MADLITLVSSVFALVLATIGTTDITLGLVAAGALIFGLAISTFKRVRGR